jgi:hypothetical protein
MIATMANVTTERLVITFFLNRKLQVIARRVRLDPNPKAQFRRQPTTLPDLCTTLNERIWRKGIAVPLAAWLCRAANRQADTGSP